jgi:hypothetical protein
VLCRLDLIHGLIEISLQDPLGLRMDGLQEVSKERVQQRQSLSLRLTWSSLHVLWSVAKVLSPPLLAAVDQSARLSLVLGCEAEATHVHTVDEDRMGDALGFPAMRAIGPLRTGANMTDVLLVGVVTDRRLEL